MKTTCLFSWVICLAILTIHSAASAQNSESICKNYAATAVSQNQVNKRAQCNYKGLRWNDDATGQAKWCMSVPPHISTSETKVREQFLRACFARKADEANDKRTPAIPGACRYNPKGYKPVHYIFNHNNDNSGPKPVALLPNGLIQHDFNQDSRKDYIFLERNHQHKFRAIFCASSRQSWQRQILTTFRENIGNSSPLFTNQISFHQGKISIGNTDTQHNWGTTSTYSEYSYSMQHKSFLLDKKTREFTSAALGVPSTKLVWDYARGEVRNTVGCGYNYQALDQPCQGAKDNEVTKMKPSEHTLALRKQLKL